MNCYEFEAGVLALVRHQLRDALAYEQGITHAAKCVQCAGRLASERMLLAGIAEVISEVAVETAPARVQTAVLAAFHKQVLAAGQTGVTPMPVRFSYWSQWRLAAVAAVIVIVAAVLATFWSQANSGDQRNGNLATLPATSGGRAPVPAVRPEQPRGEPNNRPYLAGDVAGRRMHPPATRGKRRVAEVVTEFYPMVEGEDLESLDAEQIVRVELPASALTDAGLAPGPEGSSGSVKADVVLGHDGMARAIRFVR